MRVWRQIHESKRNRVVALLQQGKNQREIAALVSVGRTTVRRIERSLGLRAQDGRRQQAVRKPRLVDIGPDPIGPIGTFPDGNTCRFIKGEPTGAFQCCGHPGFPYCEFHDRKCHDPLPSNRMEEACQ